MSDVSETEVAIKTKDSKLREIKEAWLGIDIDEKDLFNPLDMVDFNADDFHLKLSWLMGRPEYFSFICKHILNVQILPSQALMLYEMWDRTFPMLIASRGFGKSFILSLYAILRAILLPGRKIVIVGAAFRQSKVLFEYMATIWNNAPILRDLCDKNSGPRSDIDRCLLRINQSTITCLPLGDGTKIRGQRAHDIISDEFACLDGDSIVETDNGFIRIKDFDRCTDNLPTGNAKCKLEKPSKFIKTPLTDVYEIKFDNGYTVKCSSIHQMMTNHGWRKTTQLIVGDFVQKTSNRNGFKFGSTAIVDDETAWLMGVLVSEGCVTDKKRISITTTDDKMCEKLVSEYGFKLNIRDAYVDPRGWSCKKSYALYIDDERLRNRLFELGLDYVTAHGKKIPWSILKSPEETVRLFLSGLFDGDGSCFLWKDRDIENRIGLAYYSVSERLCRDVQIVMNKLGFDGYINNRPSTLSDNLQWFVRWNNQDAKTAATWLSIDRFKSAIVSCVTTDESTHVCFDKARNRWKVQYPYLGKMIQKRFVGKNDAEGYVTMLNSQPQYRQIVSITKLDKQDHLYDYYLPQTNSFYAEGFLHHNSIPREIFETVVAGFAAVSSDVVGGVQREAAKAKAAELGIEIEEIDENLIHGNETKANQIVLSGTAYYDFNHFAEYWKKWKNFIRSKGDPQRIKEIFGEKVEKDFDPSAYSVIRIPYELLPPGFMDASQVARSKATVHAGIYQMEFGACFTRDSQGFFKRAMIELCVCNMSNQVYDSKQRQIIFEAKLMGDPNKKYVFGVDPASEVDNFSIVIVEMNPDHRKIVYVWTTTRTEHKEKVRSGYAKETDFYSYCARQIRTLMKRFPCERIAMDAQGGGIAVMESLHDVNAIHEGELPIWPIIDPDEEKDTDDQRGLHILEMCQFAKQEWLGEANHGLRKDFEDKVTLFPQFDAVTVALAYEQDKMKDRIYDTLENCVMEIEELKDELAMIQMSQTPAGRDKWDVPEVVVGTGKKSKMRKDRYSALLMANMAARTIMRQPTAIEYESYGGFAYMADDDDTKKKEKDGVYANGPAWYNDGMVGVYD